MKPPFIFEFIFTNKTTPHHSFQDYKHIQMENKPHCNFFSLYTLADGRQQQGDARNNKKKWSDIHSPHSQHQGLPISCERYIDR